MIGNIVLGKMAFPINCMYFEDGNLYIKAVCDLATDVYEGSYSVYGVDGEHVYTSDFREGRFHWKAVPGMTIELTLELHIPGATPIVPSQSLLKHMG